MKVSLLTFVSTTFFHSQSHQQCIYLPEKKDKISLKAASEKKQFPQYSLHKTSKFHLISCCLNFVEAQTFCRVLGESLKNLRKLCVSTKFPHIKKLSEITVFCAVVMMSHYFIGCSFQISFKYEMLCAIWYHLYKLKTMKSTHGEVLLLVKLQAQACFTLKHWLNFLSPISKKLTGSCWWWYLGGPLWRHSNVNQIVLSGSQSSK